MHLFDIENLSIDFSTRRGTVEAVRDISFCINEEECVAVVGESGCGKSVTARSLIGLTEATGGKVREGSKILYKGENILDYSDKEWMNYRGSKTAMIFQDAMTSLNPTMKIGKQIAECYAFHRDVSKKEAMVKAVEMLRLVGIANPEDAVNRYPHEFSGGMRQRVMIASALVCNPSLLIADEPTTALDVTIQAQILDLIKELKEKEKMSVLLISHNLGVVAGLAQRVIIMYGGQIMETGTTEEIFYEALHPYTKGLQKAAPRLDEMGTGKLFTINGMPPELINPPIGCPFAERCSYATEKCSLEKPDTVKISETHSVACHLAAKEVE
ncbi:MAG: ABC transporter ATP-binding protein [Clostridia bacterium]|nr:ABC transporter ATP-binding protein [Clostridia bacterium]